MNIKQCSICDGTGQAIGVRRVFTPSGYELIDIMESIVDLLESSAAA